MYVQPIFCMDLVHPQPHFHEFKTYAPNEYWNLMLKLCICKEFRNIFQRKSGINQSIHLKIETLSATDNQVLFHSSQAIHGFSQNELEEHHMREYFLEIRNLRTYAEDENHESGISDEDKCSLFYQLAKYFLK